jgi:hypothetical protein
MNLEYLKTRIEKIVQPTREEWFALLNEALEKKVKKGDCLWEPYHLKITSRNVFKNLKIIQASF